MPPEGDDRAPVHYPPEDPDSAEIVGAWWVHARMVYVRQNEELARLFDWAEAHVRETIDAGDGEQAVAAINDVIQARPEHAELAGMCLLEPLVHERGLEVEALVAARCKDDPAWERAIRAVAVQSAQYDRLPLLAEYLYRMPTEDAPKTP